MSQNEFDAEKCDVEPRTIRALTERMVVLRDAPDLYTVVSESGSEYTVDRREGACTCPDHQRRDTRCKHLRRVTIETGCRTVPTVLDPDAMDEFLVAALEAREAADAGQVATDGGEVLGWEAHRERQQAAAADAADVTECVDGEEWCPGPDGDDLPCFACWQARDE